LKLELHDAITAKNMANEEKKKMAKELSQAQTDNFILSNKLGTVEESHQAEISSLQLEIENLQLKLKEVDKRFREQQENNLSDQNEMMELSDGGGIFEDVFGNSSRDFDNQSIGSRRRTASNLQRRTSMQGLPATLPVQDGLVTQSEVRVDNQVVKALNERVSELQRMVEEAKKQIGALDEMIENLQKNLKDEGKKLEINRRKVELKDKELEELRAKILRDNARYSEAMNESNDEVEAKNELILRMKRQLRNDVYKGHKQQAQGQENVSLLDQMNEKFKRLF
jgi:chromosome segregation ATPase